MGRNRKCIFVKDKGGYKIEEDFFPENAYVMAGEPLPNTTPADIREWLKTHTEEKDLALSMALVHNESEWLGGNLDEMPEAEYQKAKVVYETWWALEKELYLRIISILQEENRSKGTNYPTSGIGLYYVVKLFMERHGYMDGAGWWVKK